ncbi:hypothetical protein F7725_028495 [Dissostichus mawsoni]|uniref:SCP domain-containing protein n=1 Tax=Dissostichus mawsoni TaxID=36200 RepID=A0A7J5XH20_DISMA|nr:hypothetical protein F7725_028495 [Dissostichus mawsoni]
MRHCDQFLQLHNAKRCIQKNTDVMVNTAWPRAGCRQIDDYSSDVMTQTQDEWYGSPDVTAALWTQMLQLAVLQTQKSSNQVPSKDQVGDTVALVSAKQQPDLYLDDSRKHADSSLFLSTGTNTGLREASAEGGKHGGNLEQYIVVINPDHQFQHLRSPSLPRRFCWESTNVPATREEEEEEEGKKEEKRRRKILPMKTMTCGGFSLSGSASAHSWSLAEQNKCNLYRRTKKLQLTHSLHSTGAPEGTQPGKNKHKSRCKRRSLHGSLYSAASLIHHAVSVIRRRLYTSVHVIWCQCIVQHHPRSLRVSAGNNFTSAAQSSGTDSSSLSRSRRRRFISQNDMLAILDYHNKVRGKVFPPAANMEYMNLSVRTGRYRSILQLVKPWYDEVKDYSFPYPRDCNPRCPLRCYGPMCTHYTQMVWATSNKVGCAIHTCHNMNVWGSVWKRATYLVCNYSPNYGGSCSNNMCFPALKTNYLHWFK